jgi:hypothetical protein
MALAPALAARSSAAFRTVKRHIKYYNHFLQKERMSLPFRLEQSLDRFIATCKESQFKET